jgi:hypothetical protein
MDYDYHDERQVRTGGTIAADGGSPSDATRSRLGSFNYDALGRCMKRRVGSATGNARGPIRWRTSNTTDSPVQEGPNAATVDRTYVHGG